MTSKKTNKEEEAPAVVEEPKYTPAEYRAKFCMIKSRGAVGSRSVSAKYAVAANLFQWAAQAHHWGPDSFRLTRGEFEQALESAAAFPCSVPFPQAVPPVIKDKFKNFTPKKASK